jgi:hypothetical protein
MTDSREIPATRRFAWILGLAGLLPFAAHALFSWLSPPAELVGVLRSQVHYAAAILTSSVRCTGAWCSHRRRSSTAPRSRGCCGA